MYSLIIERGDKIVHLRVQKYSSPKIRMIYKIQYDKEHLLNATNFTLQKTLRRLIQNASTF